MIITVGGSVGSGKTTLARELSEKLGFKHVSAGEIMRKMAEEAGMDLLEFSKYAEKNIAVDKKIDERQREQAKGNCVVDGRLSAYFLDADLKIWLTAPFDVRVKRIMGREDIKEKEARNRILKREESERIRYKKIYDIDIDNLAIYDLVINTGKWQVKELADIVSAAVKGIEIS